MLVGGLGQERRVRPTHREGGTARVDHDVAEHTLEPKIDSPDRWEGEILPHPARDAKTVVEIVQVTLSHEEFLPTGTSSLPRSSGEGKET